MEKNYIIYHKEWICVDNPGIKVYADFIDQDLQAEVTEIGTTDASATVGVSDEEKAEQDALVSLARVHNEISNNVPAASADSVAKGYISADDYDAVVKTLIDPSRETGLKVVVSTEEISASDIEADELEKLLKAAKDKIARYADISLLVMTLDTGEYVITATPVAENGTAVKTASACLSDTDAIVYRCDPKTSYEYNITYSEHPMKSGIVVVRTDLS